MLGQFIHDQLHRCGVVRAVEENGFVEQAIFLDQACSAKKKCNVELVFLHVRILQLDGYSSDGALRAFSVEEKIIVSMLAGGAQQFDFTLMVLEAFV